MKWKALTINSHNTTILNCVPVADDRTFIFYAIQSSLCPSTCFPNPSSSSSGLRTLSKHPGYSPCSSKMQTKQNYKRAGKRKAPNHVQAKFFRFLELIRNLRNNSITRPGGARLNRGSTGHTKSSSNQPQSRQSWVNSATEAQNDPFPVKVVQSSRIVQAIDK